MKESLNSASMVKFTSGEPQIVVSATTRPLDRTDQWVGTSLAFFACAAVVALGWLFIYLFYLVRNQHQQQQGITPHTKPKASRGQTQPKIVLAQAQPPVPQPTAPPSPPTSLLPAPPAAAPTPLPPRLQPVTTPATPLQSLISASKPSGRVTFRTENKLLTLLHNDRGAAERLVGRAMSLHPGKPENWYWEKVIWDLERDRQQRVSFLRL